MPKKKSSSQADIATELGISISTVSRALVDSPNISEEIRRNVRECALRIGYPIKPKHNAVGFEIIFVFYSVADFNNARSSIYHELLNGIRDEASKYGALVETVMTRTCTPVSTQISTRMGATTGAIFLGLSPARETLDDFSKRGIAAVIANGIEENLRLDSVTPANFVGGAIVAQHLIHLGHRRFLYFSGRNRLTLQRRFAGFRQHLENGTDSLNTKLVSVFTLDQSDSTDPERAEFLEWFERFCDKATVIVCFNDSAAVWVMEALQSFGVSVPSAMSVVGFDDMPIATMVSPELTTFHVNWNAVGSEAVQILHNRLNAPNSEIKLVQIGGKLISRSSVLKLSPVNS